MVGDTANVYSQTKCVRFTVPWNRNKDIRPYAYLYHNRAGVAIPCLREIQLDFCPVTDAQSEAMSVTTLSRLAMQDPDWLIGHRG